MAGSSLCPTVAHLVPGRGNGPWDLANNLKESGQHAAFYQPAGERAVSRQDRRNEGQEVWWSTARSGIRTGVGQVPAAVLPPCPLLGSHPGLRHRCLSGPSEACVSFSIAGWDVNVPVPQRGRKKTFWKASRWSSGSKSEQSWAGAQLWSPSGGYFLKHWDNKHSKTCERDGDKENLPSLSISVSSCAFLWSWECSSSSEEGINDEIHFWAAYGMAQGKSFLEDTFPFLNGSLMFGAKYCSREMRQTNGEIFSWKEEERAVIRIHSSVQDILRSAWEQPNKRRKLERGKPGDSDVHGDSPEGVGAMSSLGREMVILPEGGFFPISHLRPLLPVEGTGGRGGL